MDSGRRPRLCHMVKWKNYDGYGFNLHAEKHKTGHYIGNVDDDSPASLAGLLEGDRVIEVNGKSVVNYTHAQVVNAIKDDPNETKLLVVDPLTDAYFEEENIPINGELKNILYIKGDPPAGSIYADSPNLSKANTSIASSNLKQDRTSGLGTPTFQMSPTRMVSSPVGASAATATVAASAAAPIDEGIGSTSSPQLRLCHLRERPDFDGYGFNLHFEQGSANDLTASSHYIGKVDPGSPAQLGGLRRGDILVEINGTPVADMTHDQVVDAIKADPDHVSMLVSDPGSIQAFKQMGIAPSGHWGNILVSPPPSTPTSSPPTSDPGQRRVPSGTVSPAALSHGPANGSVSPVSRSSAVGKASPLITPRTLSPAPDKVVKGSGGDYVPMVVGNTQPCSKLPPVKLCHLRKWSDFEGYGFNLHAGKDGMGHYIGHIDSLSPAEYAGLGEGDKIVEVNRENVERMDHKEVVRKIRTDPEQASLLVVDEKTDEYFENNKLPITARWDNLVEYRTPFTNPKSKKGASTASPLMTAVSPSMSASPSRTPGSPSSTAVLSVAAQRTPDWKRGAGYVPGDRTNGASGIGGRSLEAALNEDGVGRRPITTGGPFVGGREDVGGPYRGSERPLGSTLPGVAYAVGSSPGGITYDNFAERKAREVITTSRSEVSDSGSGGLSPSRSGGGLLLHGHRGSVPPVPPTHMFKLYSWTPGPTRTENTYGLELCDRADIAEGATFVQDVVHGSPAGQVGMRPDTLILEVNDVPIFGKSAREVQMRIDESYPEVKILVHDPAPATLGGGNAPTMAHKITALPKYIEGPRSDPAAGNNIGGGHTTEFSIGGGSGSNKSLGLNGSLHSYQNGNDSSAKTPNQGSTDPWNMSASEMRAKIALESKKKKDQKLDNRPLKEKFDLLQKM